MPVDHVFSDLIRGWQTYQAHLIDALTPLTAEQLALRAAPEQRTIGAIATHIVGARARWTSQVLHEGGPELEALARFDRDGPAERPAAELVQALLATWEPLKNGLERWQTADYDEKITVERRGEQHTFTRGWVVWHLIEHDLHHGGEISLLLGMHRLPAVDI